MNELLGQQAFSLIGQPSELSDALLDLSVSEIRLIQLAIMNSREIKGEINTSTPLTVSAEKYAEAFGGDVDSAYKAIIAAEEVLFERAFSFKEEDGEVKSRWIEQTAFIEGLPVIEVMLAPMVVREINRLNAIEGFMLNRSDNSKILE